MEVLPSLVASPGSHHWEPGHLQWEPSKIQSACCPASLSPFSDSQDPKKHLDANCIYSVLGLPQCLSSKKPTGDARSIPGSGRPPGGRHSNPLQYSCLENPIDRGVWWATVHRVAKSQDDWSNLAYTHALQIKKFMAKMDVRGLSVYILFQYF